MFLKIFRYEFKTVLKIMLITTAVSLGLALLFGGVVRIIEEIIKNASTENPMSLVYAQLFSEFVSAIAKVGIAAALAVQEIILFIRFYKSVASDEAYLTFTLPASDKDQHRARTLVMLVWSVICVTVMLCDFCLFETIAYGTTDRNMIVMIYNDVFYGEPDILPLIEAIVLGFIAECTIILEVMLAVMIANRVATKFKIGATIGFIALFYYVQVALLLLSAITLFWLYSSVEAFWSNTLVFTELVMLGYIIVFALLGCLSFFFTGKLFKKINI